MFEEVMAMTQKQHQVPLVFHGSPEMRFFAAAAFTLSLFLIAAKHLCPDPINPPTLVNPTFEWGA
jgi:hypothetical protein